MVQFHLVDPCMRRFSKIKERKISEGWCTKVIVISKMLARAGVKFSHLSNRFFSIQNFVISSSFHLLRITGNSQIWHVPLDFYINSKVYVLHSTFK